MSEQEYVLGTHDEEISRLGLQHRVWRPRALDAWRRGGFTKGQTILDLGCGPGYASIDLAEIVGPEGRVIAVDRSKRFLDHLGKMQAVNKLTNITRLESDLDSANLPPGDLDGVWCRWIFAFVRQPKDLLGRICPRIRKGGSIIIHEYFNYATWSLSPRLPEMEEFVQAVMKSWREAGGEPDIGLMLLPWLREYGFDIREIRPIIDIVSPDNFVWQWPRAFVKVNLQRQADLGVLTGKRADEILKAFEDREKRPGTLMVTPAVVEIIATCG